MEHGTVESFNARKEYGYFRSESGVQYFFHLRDGRHIVAGERAPKFTDEPVITPPVIGEPVCFRRTNSTSMRMRWAGLTVIPNVYRAYPWGFACQYEKAQQEIAAKSGEIEEPAP